MTCRRCWMVGDWLWRELSWTSFVMSCRSREMWMRSPTMRWYGLTSVGAAVEEWKSVGLEGVSAPATLSMPSLCSVLTM